MALEMDDLARPSGSNPPQNAPLQAVQKILLLQQDQTPSNVSARQLPTVLMAYTPQTRSSTVYEKFKGSQSVVLGGLQIATGCLALAMDSAGFGMQVRTDNYNGTEAFYIFSSIWCGVFFFIAGGFAIGSGKKKTNCLLAATAVMEAFSLFFALTFFGISSWATADLYEICAHANVRCRQYVKVTQAMAAIMLICSVAQIIFSIWELVLCGKVLCPCGGTTPCCTNCCDCCCPTYGQAFMFVNGVSAKNGQLVQVASPGAQPVTFALAPSANQVSMRQNQTEGRNITPTPDNI